MKKISMKRLREARMDMDLIIIDHKKKYGLLLFILTFILGPIKENKK